MNGYYSTDGKFIGISVNLPGVFIINHKDGTFHTIHSTLELIKTKYKPK